VTKRLNKIASLKDICVCIQKNIRVIRVRNALLVILVTQRLQLCITDNVRTHVRHVTKHLSTHLILRNIFVYIPENVRTHAIHVTKPLTKVVYLKDICVCIQKNSHSTFDKTSNEHSGCKCDSHLQTEENPYLKHAFEKNV